MLRTPVRCNHSCAIGRRTQSLAKRNAAACKLQSAEQLAPSSSMLAASRTKRKFRQGLEPASSFVCRCTCQCRIVAPRHRIRLNSIGELGCWRDGPQGNCHYARPGSNAGRPIGSVMSCQDASYRCAPLAVLQACTALSACQPRSSCVPSQNLPRHQSCAALRGLLIVVIR